MSQDSNARPIRRLLVANRGEIATRIISAAREMDLETYALYTDNDASHAYNASHAIKLSSPAAYLDINELLKVCKDHDIDAVHPGYGFLSESADLAQRMQNAGINVVGPGFEILDRTGDKLQARRLAEECHVPVLPALTTPTDDYSVVAGFAKQAGYPIMIKAVDGGGGRGIRLAEEEAGLEKALRRAIEESPSRQIFAEKAAVSGYRHIEVQIIGDHHGNIRHLWERECSIQRRCQKIFELAPSSITDRRLVSQVIQAAMRMARKIHYRSLGTFEFLVNPSTSDFYFLEINPRLQVEHTVTESICMTDIVKAQLLIAQGAAIAQSGLDTLHDDPERPPPLHSLQLRITAEDPQKNWSLSVGKIQSFHFPSGNGIRIDTNLVGGASAVVSSDYDSLIAKLIITASTWEGVLQKAKRTLEDTRIIGIQTNISALYSIIAHPDFISGRCDTQWLEKNLASLLSARLNGSEPSINRSLFSSASTPSIPTSLSTSSLLFRKDDAWSLTLNPLSSPTTSPSPASHTTSQAPYHLQLTKLLRNDFPSSLAAEITFTAPSSSPHSYHLQLSSTTSSASALTSSQRRGDASNPAHVIIPFSGKLVEVCVDVGDVVKEGDTVAVVRQMKMELEVRAHRGGRVCWVTEVEDGEDVGEGLLACVLEDVGSGAGVAGERAKL